MAVKVSSGAELCWQTSLPPAKVAVGGVWAVMTLDDIAEAVQPNEVIEKLLYVPANNPPSEKAPPATFTGWGLVVAPALDVKFNV